MGDQLKDKVAVITGSGRGQGLAAARLFASEGARIVINDLDEDSVRQAVEDIVAAGGQAVGACADVSNAAEVQRMLSVARDSFGGLDIIYNNAGIGYSATARMGVGMGDILSCSEEDWRRVMDINLGGVFLVCKFGLPMLIERGGGSIINTASIAALKGARNAHAYSASKGGIVALTRSLAVTYGRQGVRANAICPGVIDTDMIRDTMLASADQVAAIRRLTPLGEVGSPEHIASVALFLASDAGSFITGQAIAVDGGVTA